MGLIATEEGDIEACEWVEDCRQAAGSSFFRGKNQGDYGTLVFFLQKKAAKHYEETL